MECSIGMGVSRPAAELEGDDEAEDAACVHRHVTGHALGDGGGERVGVLLGGGEGDDRLADDPVPDLRDPGRIFGDGGPDHRVTSPEGVSRTARMPGVSEAMTRIRASSMSGASAARRPSASGLQAPAPATVRPCPEGAGRGARCPPTGSAPGRGRRRAVSRPPARPCASAGRPVPAPRACPCPGGERANAASRSSQRQIQVVARVAPAKLSRSNQRGCAGPGAPGSMAISSKYSSGPSDRRRFHVPIASCCPPGASGRPARPRPPPCRSAGRSLKRRCDRASAWGLFVAGRLGLARAGAAEKGARWSPAALQFSAKRVL
jgi:hypothetical protein